MLGGAISNPGSFACRAFPAGCGATPSCACLGAVACGSICTQSAGGDLTATCAFP
jgi:hypothetical protein